MLRAVRAMTMSGFPNAVSCRFAVRSTKSLGMATTFTWLRKSWDTLARTCSGTCTARRASA